MNKFDIITACPFNTEVYAKALPNLGEVEMDPTFQLPVLRRRIPGTAYSDGVGPWPYLWIESDADIEKLYVGFRHLVTLSIVTQPGHVPKAKGDDAKFLKQHYVYDPGLPRRPLSRRARERLSRCEAHAAFEVVSNEHQRMEMVGLYEGLKHRRGLTGGLFDHGRRYFENISELNNGIFFRVLNNQGLGAMACGVEFAGILQILHTVISEHGLRWNASYLLMHGLQDYARAHRLRLLTGGMPDAGADGLRIFKERWANSFAPVYLLRIVNDRPRYAELCAGKDGDGYFPAYRQR
ncbi:hypothetical protein [Methylobacterium oryzae]|uniref:hypothetical protein n=1 Tax=Methylobacterium oryzae TaxID=334852 RepID=UPI001F1B34D0|nr:hypothetical protein [Methylobacterium oryzae]UIN34046.1 hypothetical protein LXM90_23655 [Methylobacterium oryzae]